MLRGSLDAMGAGRRMDTCVCMAESFRGSPEIITILLISCTPIENKKFKLKKIKKIKSWINFLGKKNKGLG